MILKNLSTLSFGSIGGGGLMSGLSTYVKNLSPHTQMIGVEPAGAASMKAAFKEGALSHLTRLINSLMVRL